VPLDTEMTILNRTLTSITDALPLLLPEWILMAGFIFILIADLMLKGQSEDKRKRLLLSYQLITLLAAFTATYMLYRDAPFIGPFFNGFLWLIPVGLWLKMLLIGVTFLITVLFGFHKGDEVSDYGKGEYHLFTLALLLGASFLSMAANLLSILLALEIMSLSAYALTAFRASEQAAKEALRYFLLGAVATAVMIYGMSFLYGFTGTLQWTSAEFWQGLSMVSPVAVWLFFSFFLVGFLFKIAAIPFHFWVTGVYRTAPWSSVALFALVPKLAAMGFLFQLSGSWDQMAEFLIPLIAIITLLSLLVGNFAALREGDARVLMAWSSVAQAGFLLAFLLLPQEMGGPILYFYLAVYALAALIAFWVIDYIGRKKKSFQLEDWSSGTPVHGLILVLGLVAFISLIGIPPVAGFTAKLFLFSSLAELYGSTNNPWILAVLLFAVMNTAISAFYYLRIPYQTLMLTKREEGQPKALAPRFFTWVVPGMLVLVLVLVFLRPGLLTLAANSFTFGAY